MAPGRLLIFNKEYKMFWDRPNLAPVMARAAEEGDRVLWHYYGGQGVGSWRGM